MTKKKPVQPAEAKQPEDSTSDKETVGAAVPAEVQPQQKSPEVSAKTEPQIPIEISPQALERAKALGINLAEFFEWAQSVEARLNAIRKEMPQQIQEAMENAIENARKKAIAQTQSQLQESGQRGDRGDQISLPQLLSLLGTGAGMDEEMLQLQKDMFRLNIDNMKEDIGFTRAIKNALVQKIAGQAVGETLK